MNQHAQDFPDRDDVEDLDQEEPPELVRVPVVVDGTVRTRSLPRLKWTARNYTLAAGEARMLGGRELQRASMKVWITTWAGAGTCPVLYIGTTETGVRTGTEGIVPPVVGIPVEMNHCDYVYVFNNDAANAVTISVTTEIWAD